MISFLLALTLTSGVDRGYSAAMPLQHGYETTSDSIRLFIYTREEHHFSIELPEGFFLIESDPDVVVCARLDNDPLDVRPAIAISRVPDEDMEQFTLQEMNSILKDVKQVFTDSFSVPEPVTINNLSGYGTVVSEVQDGRVYRSFIICLHAPQYDSIYIIRMGAMDDGSSYGYYYYLPLFEFILNTFKVK